MSLINQVLNELESRGVNVPLGEATIRAVPPRKQPHVLRYAFVAVLALMLLALAKWYSGRTETPAPGSAIIAAPVYVAALASSSVISASAPEASSPVSSDAVAAPTSGMSRVLNAPLLSADRRDKPLLVVQSEESPVAAPDVRKIARNKPQHTFDRETENADTSPEGIADNLQLKKVSPQQRAENEFQKANLAVQEGRTNDALAGYEAALLIDSSHKAARRAWVGLLISLKRNDDAERVLEKGIKRDPKDISFSMLMARLQVERNDLSLALETLQKTLPYAENQPDYQAFLAALLQRQSRHEEAITHYQIALKLAPGNGIWLMGMGISLQALQRKEDARDAYQRALATNSLSPQLQAFVQQKLKEL